MPKERKQKNSLPNKNRSQLNQKNKDKGRNKKI